MNTIRVLFLVGLVGAALAMAAPAVADGQCGYGYGFGYGYDMGYLYGTLDYRVPYFAAHPPVYYSAPVPRSYGYSPFAYPPYVQTPEVVEEAKPVVLINPHVQSSTSEAVPQDRSTSIGQEPQPLVVLNPYVDVEAPIARVAR